MYARTTINICVCERVYTLVVRVFDSHVLNKSLLGDLKKESLVLNIDLTNCRMPVFVFCLGLCIYIYNIMCRA